MSLPPVGSRVVYFPQGHIEQVCLVDHVVKVEISSFLEGSRCDRPYVNVFVVHHVFCDCGCRTHIIVQIIILHQRVRFVLSELFYVQCNQFCSLFILIGKKLL